MSVGALGAVASIVVVAGIAAMFMGSSSEPPVTPASALAPAADVPAFVDRPAAPAVATTFAYTPEPVAIAADSRRSGVAAYNTGNVEGSIASFLNATEANPDDPETLNNLGQALVRAGRPSDAIPHFDRAIGLAGGVWSYRFNRARAFAELKQWPRAVADYRDAAKLFPEDYATQFNLAKALQANGDLGGAITAFQRAITLAPGQADFHLSLGLAQEAAQRPRDAATSYRAFLELEPASPDAERVRGRIAQLEGTAPPATVVPATTP